MNLPLGPRAYRTGGLIGPSYEVNVATHSRLGVPATAEAAEEKYNQDRAGILTNPAADFLGGPDFQSCHRCKMPIYMTFRFREAARRFSDSTPQALDASTAADWPDIEFLFLDAWSGY